MSDSEPIFAREHQCLIISTDFRSLRLRPFYGAWLVVSLLVPLLLFFAASWYDRAVILRGGGERLTSATDALAAHAEAVVQTAELTLSLQLAAIEGMSWQEIGTSEYLHHLLVSFDKQLLQVVSAFFVDPDGFNSASSREFPMPRYDVRTREYYAAAKQGNYGVIVSAPFQGLSGGEVGFTISRARLTDGRFDGVAAVTLPESYFVDLYHSVMQWPDASAALLVRKDGVVLARYATIGPAPAVLPADSDTMRIAAARRDTIFDAISKTDGRPKIAAVHWLPGRDLMVVAAIDRGKLLQAWYVHVALFAGFALIAALALSSTAVAALRRSEQERTSLEALVTETSRRQQAEAALQQAQKMDALGRLTGGVAHDFNNLLTAILGSLELALRRVSDPAVTRLLGAATTAAQRGARLTAQMLTFARKRTLEPQTLNGNEVVRGMDELLRRSIGPLVHLDYRLESELWPITADRVQLELAILNLVVNAQDAMPDGGELTISTCNVPAGAGIARELPAGDYVALRVADIGHGMTADVRASAFEPFFTTKEPGKGTGLGLSMVYGFVQQAGGAVQIDSAPGSGTTVSIYLPRAAKIVEGPTARALQPDQTTRIELLVLLVDDDAAAREPTAAMLRELGCIVTEVDRGAAALELLRSSMPFDVLLLDFAMPEMNGAQLASAGRALRPNLPIVFLTGYADVVLLEQLLGMGVQVVTKPFRLDALAAALWRAARQSAAAA